jgi:uncharacterized membrane protein YeiH
MGRWMFSIAVFAERTKMKRQTNWIKLLCLGALGIAIAYAAGMLRDYLRIRAPADVILVDTLIDVCMLVLLFVFVVLPILRDATRRDQSDSKEEK